MGARENPAQRECWRELGRAGAKAFRINTGRAWAGKGTRLEGGAVLVQPAQLVCLGFADVHNEPVAGVGDLAGWLPVVVTPEMVGHTIAVYINPECKPPKNGRVSKEQNDHIALVRRDGGIAGVVKCAADVRAMIADWFARFRQPEPPE